MKDRHPRVAVAALLGGALLLISGCSARTYVDGLFGTAAPTPPPASGDGQPAVYYAKSDGVKVYSEPRFSSSVVAVLKGHQKVYRYAVERGFARVTVEGSRVQGWVDNAELIWRLPAAAAPVGAVEEEPPAEQPVELQQAPPPTSDQEEPQPTATHPPMDAPPQSHPAAGGTVATPRARPTDTPAVNPSVFDPF